MGMAQLWPRAGASWNRQSPSFKCSGHANFAAYSSFTNELWNEGLLLDFNRLYGDIIMRFEPCLSLSGDTDTLKLRRDRSRDDRNSTF